MITSCFFVYGQNDTIVNKICLERGHVCSGVINKTAMYCPPYLIDTDSTTIIVYPACNYEIFTCLRCGKKITRLEKERRIIINKKEKWKRTEQILY